MSNLLQPNIFRDLATLCDAGISISDAAKRVAKSHPKIKEWDLVISDLQKGSKLNVSLSKRGLITRYEQEIVSVGEFSGRLVQSLKHISESYDKRRSRIAKLKSKLYMPFAVLTVAIIVSGILKVSQNPEISIVSVIISLVFYSTLALGITKLILHFMQKEANFWLNLVRNYDKSEWYQMQFQQVTFGALLWQLSSGIDFKTGFARIAKLIDSKDIRRKLLAASAACGQGQSVCQSVDKAQLPITPELKQVLITGEKSGQFEEAIGRFLEQNAILLDIMIDNAFEWTPRIYYGLIVLTAISVIL
ncbi:MAG: type II secretion system F family protein [Kangiellaceae bacterium]|nr:type II secretion system F family protein [Kangiellaceae bacterium]